MGKASRKKKEAQQLPEYVHYVMSNNPSPRLFGLVEMFTRGAIENQIGVMEAFNKETGGVEELLVGLDEQGNAYPLARMLDATEMSKYLAPNGKGGFYGLEEPEHVEPAETA